MGLHPPFIPQGSPGCWPSLHCSREGLFCSCPRLHSAIKNIHPSPLPITLVQIQGWSHLVTRESSWHSSVHFHFLINCIVSFKHWIQHLDVQRGLLPANSKVPSWEAVFTHDPFRNTFFPSMYSVNTYSLAKCCLIGCSRFWNNGVFITHLSEKFITLLTQRISTLPGLDRKFKTRGNDS